jgi:hypothetical protein
MTIKLITFKTNHTILGEVDEQLGNKLFNDFKIKKPVQVVVQPTKEGPMMGFAPFLDYAEEFSTGIELNKVDVLCVTSPSRELENQYNQVFGSGIQIASAIPKV